MSELLQTYEEEYREALAALTEELSALRATMQPPEAGSYKAPPASGPGSRSFRVTAMTERLVQMKELISNMEYECHDVPAALREAVKVRVDGYRKKVRELDDQLTSVKQEARTADRKDLLSTSSSNRAAAPGSALGPLDDETKAHRAIMLENTEKFKQGSRALNDAERLLGQTEAIGQEALTTLRGQTETMVHINETTIAVDEEVSEARKILSSMQRTMIKHKAMLVGIILTLILLIIVAVYVSVSKSRSHDVHPTQVPVDPIPTYAESP